MPIAVRQIPSIDAQRAVALRIFVQGIADNGNDTGTGTISNGQVEVTIDASMREGRTVAGLAPASPSHVLSHCYVMRQTYTVKNASDGPPDNMSLFRFINAHPNNDYGPNNYGVYDPAVYVEAADGFPGYRYDMGFFAPEANWQQDMDDLVGFSSAKEPDAWQSGEFSGHGGEPGLSSLHHQVEADTLSSAGYIAGHWRSPAR